MVQKDWFATWFDTPYYHILYKKRDDLEAQRFINNLVNNLAITEGNSILDLACGKGRHSITMNKLGFDVLGVDLSENSILEAKKHENSGLRFAVHDMREVLDNRFDAVFNLFTSFGYFNDLSDNDRVIASVYQMLNPDGIFLIDFMNSEKVIDQLVMKERKTEGGIEFEIERKYTGTHIVKDIRFVADGRNHHFTESVQALKLGDFTRLLSNQGFEIIDTFGDFDLNNFDPKTSDRLIIHAKKKA